MTDGSEERRPPISLVKKRSQPRQPNSAAASFRKAVDTTSVGPPPTMGVANVSGPGAPITSGTDGSDRRSPMLGLLVLVLVLGLATAGAGLALKRQFDSGEPKRLDAAERPAASAGPTQSASLTDTASDELAAADVGTRREPNFRCWDGSTAKRLSGCGDPTIAATQPAHLAGLNWVFQERGPLLEELGARCAHFKRLEGRDLHRSCSFMLDGQAVCMNWSQWLDPRLAREDYDRLGLPSRRARPDGATELVWGPERGGQGCDGLPFKTAAMIEGEVWGVTAYAERPEATSMALNRLAQFRSVGQWQGLAQD